MRKIDVLDAYSAVSCAAMTYNTLAIETNLYVISELAQPCGGLP